MRSKLAVVVSGEQVMAGEDVVHGEKEAAVCDEQVVVGVELEMEVGTISKAVVRVEP